MFTQPSPTNTGELTMPARKKRATQVKKQRRPARKRETKPKVAPTVVVSQADVRIHELEVENRHLKAQLAEQRNSSTMLQAPPPKPAQTYRGLAITFGVATFVLLIVLIWLNF